MNAAPSQSLINLLLESGVRRADFARRGVQRAGQFKWETCARATLDVYRAVRQQENTP